ncbi:alpha/beta hydrolase [Paenibacillus terrigena]|uniref:alpha/beta fold hydrolase n=1 Tax=Paenibacillus terrigena TaxID=369333 RepID=UPI0028D78745|nr:alpha/beta hydrolase [Paenibacillus terrigena]
MGYFVEVEPRVKIYVEDVGSGEPIVLIHGWPVNHQMFEYQTSMLPKYGYRCISIDIRGFGQSDKPWYGYSYDRLSDDVRTVIDALQLERVRLIGFSVGGAIAIRYMARHSGRKVAQLILLGAASPSFTKRPDFPYGNTVNDVDALIEQTTVNRPQMIEDFGQKFFFSPITESFRSWFQLLGLQASSHGTIAVAESLRDEDLRQDLNKILVQTTLLHGVKDKICPYTLALATHKGIPGSVLVPFEKSGHGLFYDEREKCNKLILKALRGLQTTK